VRWKTREHLMKLWSRMQKTVGRNDWEAGKKRWGVENNDDENPKSKRKRNNCRTAAGKSEQIKKTF